jgi:hypothetical protein
MLKFQSNKPTVKTRDLKAEEIVTRKTKKKGATVAKPTPRHKGKGKH